MVSVGMGTRSGSFGCVASLLVANACYRAPATTDARGDADDARIDSSPVDTASVDGAMDASTARSWGTPELIETFSFGNTIEPSVAINESGQIIVAWIDDGGTGQLTGALWGNEYSPSTGWADARPIASTPSAWYPHATIGPDGRGVVVWTESAENDPTYAPMAVRYSPGSGWSPAESAANIAGTRGNGGGSTLAPPPDTLVSQSSDGHILIAYPTIWAKTGIADTIVNIYDPATGWGNAQALLSTPVYLVRAQMDADGLGVIAVIDNQSCSIVRQIKNLGWTEFTLDDIGNLSCVDSLAAGSSGALLVAAGDVPKSGSGLDLDEKAYTGAWQPTQTLISAQQPYSARNVLAIGADLSSVLVVSELSDDSTVSWSGSPPGAAVPVTSHGFDSYAVRTDQVGQHHVLLSQSSATGAMVTRMDASWHADELSLQGSCGPIPGLSLPAALAIANNDRAVAVWAAQPMNGGLCNLWAVRRE